MGGGPALETGADLSGNRRFESISLQRRVQCEPYFPIHLAPGPAGRRALQLRSFAPRANTSRLPTWLAAVTMPSASIRSIIRAARL